MHVVAVVVADRAGIDPLTRIAGVPMVVWSVRAVLASGVVGRVMLDADERVLRACSKLPVDAWDPVRVSDGGGAHGGQRVGGAHGDDPPVGVLLVHDLARPLAPPGLFAAVVAAVRAGADAAAPVLPLTDTVKLVDDDGMVLGTPERSGLRVVQTPYALRAAGMAVHSAPSARPTGLAARAVPGDPLAFPVRTDWDLELAELLARA